MLSLLNAPCPFYSLNLQRLLSIIGVGAFIALFLVYFQPFGTANGNYPNKSAFLLGYGVAVIITMLLFEFMLNRLFFNEQRQESWTIGKQILLTLLEISLVIVACYFYKQCFFKLSVTRRDLFYFYKIAFAVALSPIIIIELVQHIFHLRKNQIAAASINNQLSQEAPKEKIEETTRVLLLMAENAKDSFSVNENDLCYIQSADNYAEIVYLEGDEQKKEILRNSLQRLEQQIGEQLHKSSIIRCHRSFLVNIDQILSISGNSQGYKLHLKNGEFAIPISRSRSKDVLARINQRT